MISRLICGVSNACILAELLHCSEQNSKDKKFVSAQVRERLKVYLSWKQLLPDPPLSPFQEMEMTTAIKTTIKSKK